MQPTTSGRFRVHDRHVRPTVGDADSADDGTRSAAGDAAPTGDDATVEQEAGGDPPEEFVLVEIPEEPIDPAAPGAEDAYDPVYVAAEGYPETNESPRSTAAEPRTPDPDGGSDTTVSSATVADLDPGNVVDATLAWHDGRARFAALSVVRESRFRFADDVDGMFEAAVETWQRIRADGEAVGSITTRSNDGDPNGALYLFADAPGSDTFEELRSARLPVEPLVARVNAERGTEPREVFVLRPAAHAFVAVYVVFEPDGVLARTIQDTYDLGGGGLASALDASLDRSSGV